MLKFDNEIKVVQSLPLRNILNRQETRHIVHILEDLLLPSLSLSLNTRDYFAPRRCFVRDSAVSGCVYTQGRSFQKVEHFGYLLKDIRGE